MSIVKSEDGKKWINAFVVIISILVGFIFIRFLEQMGEWFDLEAKIMAFEAVSQGAGILMGLATFFLIFKSHAASSHLKEVYGELSKLTGEQLLIKKGYSPRKIALTASSALAVLPLVSETDFLFSINKLYAENHAEKFNLDFRAMPSFVPTIKLHMVWSPVMDDTLWHRWLRGYAKSCIQNRT